MYPPTACFSLQYQLVYIVFLAAGHISECSIDRKAVSTFMPLRLVRMVQYTMKKNGEQIYIHAHTIQEMAF